MKPWTPHEDGIEPVLARKEFESTHAEMFPPKEDWHLPLQESEGG